MIRVIPVKGNVGLLQTAQFIRLPLLSMKANLSVAMAGGDFIYLIIGTDNIVTLALCTCMQFGS